MTWPKNETRLGRAWSRRHDGARRLGALGAALVVTFLLIAGLTAPPGARADGALTRVGGELRYDSDPQDAADLVISRQTEPFECSPTSNPAAAPCLQFGDAQEIRNQAAGCVRVIATVVACSPPSAFTSIFLKLDDGNDFVRVLDNVPPTTMDGSFDNDNLSSRNGADIALGGPGDDEIADDDSTADDMLDGGADDDTISLGGGDDNVIGGTGADTVILDTGNDTLRLDDIANDGSPGEAKNVRSDVEVIDGNGGSDSLFGNGAANTLLGASGNDLIDGGGGPDVLEGGSGADELNGGPDVDRVVYSDSGGQTITLDDVRNDGASGELDNVHADIEDVAAGPGNDNVVGSDLANVIDGGDGNDRLEGRGAVDTFFGGSGADALFARDGSQERVECGPDTDTGEADTIDLLVGCEGVLLSSELVPDVDGDGVNKPTDCNDENPAIRPGAFDTPQNGIDEDCSGADAQFPPQPEKRITSPVRLTWGVSGRNLFLLRLSVTRVPKGAKAELRCSRQKSKKCPFKRKASGKRSNSAITLFKEIKASEVVGKKQRSFRAGQRLELRITTKDFIGKVVRFDLRKDKIPSGRSLCLPPGAKKPRKRC